MNDKEYHDVEHHSRAELQRCLASTSSLVICAALVSAAFHETDWRWVQGQCLAFLSHGNPDVRGVAATCFGHLARIHHVLDESVVRPALGSALNDPLISGRAEDALDDMSIFLTKRSG